MSPLLSVRELTVRFPRHGVTAVEQLSFDVAPAESVALVGASGSGKSTVGLALMGLLGPDAERANRSRIAFDGIELTTANDATWRALRGRRLAMVFQDPAAALNPAMTIHDQIAEVAIVHGGSSAATAQQDAAQMLDRVGLSANLAPSYPHELSGGQCQRAMLAMALLLRPALLIADEPTSSLDVLAQAEILALLGMLRRDSGTALLLITHDPAIVAAHCSRALVMADGRLVERVA
jgi:ABC-type glutathione transport system ATPase component